MYISLTDIRDAFLETETVHGEIVWPPEKRSTWNHLFRKKKKTSPAPFFRSRPNATGSAQILRIISLLSSPFYTFLSTFQLLIFPAGKNFCPSRSSLPLLPSSKWRRREAPLRRGPGAAQRRPSCSSCPQLVSQLCLLCQAVEKGPGPLADPPGVQAGAMTATNPALDRSSTPTLPVPSAVISVPKKVPPAWKEIAVADR